MNKKPPIKKGMTASTADIHKLRILTSLKSGLLLMMVVGGAFTFINFFGKLYILSAVEALVFIIFSFLLYLVSRNIQFLETTVWIFLISTGLWGLYVFYLPKPGDDLSVFVWQFIVYVLAIFLLGLPKGLIFSLFFYILVSTIFLLKFASGEKALPVVCIADILIANAVIIFFSFYYEKVRSDTEKALQEANQKLVELSAHDGLTGLYNRRYFDKMIEMEWKRSIRSGQPLSLIMADIDFFKNYNDTYGHLKGDDCIRAVAKAIRASVKRPCDIAARYGGEEFAIILPNTNSDGAKKIAQIAKNCIRNNAIPHKGSKIDNIVTMSLGISTAIPNSSSKPDDIIAQADDALYKSKTDGRDRITVSYEKTALGIPGT